MTEDTTTVTTAEQTTEAAETIIVYETIDITPVVDRLDVITGQQQENTAVILILTGCVIAAIVSSIIVGVFHK